MEAASFDKEKITEEKYEAYWNKNIKLNYRECGLISHFIRV
jgi:hypothetical protein